MHGSHGIAGSLNVIIVVDGTHVITSIDGYLGGHYNSINVHEQEGCETMRMVRLFFENCALKICLIPVHLSNGWFLEESGNHDCSHM